MKVFAIIPAAGIGRRFGAQKQFLDLEGQPLLSYTLRAFENSPLIDGVYLAVPEGETSAVQQWSQWIARKKPVQIYPGGKERQESVRLGLKILPSCDFVLVHDGVRPFVTPSLIESVLEGAQAVGGCIPGLPLKETTKSVTEEGWVRETIDRTYLWSIQTPQAFSYEILREAFEKATKDNFYGTDEAMLVERLGRKIKVITGLPWNIKITTRDDWELAKTFLPIWEKASHEDRTGLRHP
ncbi:MAG: 2-C-methyl-D-erythritol 4-phosphate cytidylyltransferase [Deltaproteobacteria bacterium]|nr:2-C-methyl-D-erythritol 4-phosphate cytidylyltransferase [Deltaproteobacteria bacterium]MBI2500843.1 2-C-methyl-D-erythritol 4-phosphate cytidylyltransferase [Deltaproteobacteria bacterium]